MKEETKEKLVGEGVNNGKRAEERDRVKHGTEGLLSNK